MSPYPVDVIVTIAYHIADGMLLNSVPGTSVSA
jgi:hypothetical protein